MANLIMPLQIERQYGASLDADYAFDTLDELKNYATTSALSYSGQILYCKKDDTLYKVNSDKTDVASIGSGRHTHKASEVKFTKLDGTTTTVQDALGGGEFTPIIINKPASFKPYDYNLIAEIQLPDNYMTHHNLSFMCLNNRPQIANTFDRDADIYRFDLHMGTPMENAYTSEPKLRFYGFDLYEYPTADSSVSGINLYKDLAKCIKGYYDVTNRKIYIFLIATNANYFNGDLGTTKIEYTGNGTIVDSFQVSNFWDSEYLKWTQVCELEDLESPTIFKLGGDSSGNSKTYTTLDELGLTADVTFQDVVDILPKGGSALLGVTEFTNYQTIFPYEEGNDQFARVYIVKGTADGSRMYARWFRKDGVKEAIAIFNINDNKFGGWRMLKDQQTYTSLNALGLTAPVSVGEIFNAMPNNTMAVLACEAKDETDGTVNISDIPMSFGVLTIKKNETGRFSIDYQNSLSSSPCNVKRWIGTLKGLDGTGLYWKLVSTQTTYTALSDMGLTADATVQDVIDALPVGCTAHLRTDGFTNWSTLFNDIQWGYFRVEKTVGGLSNIELQEVVLPNRRYFGAQSSGKFNKWQKVASEITDVLTNSSTIAQVPNAKLVAGEIYGKYFDIADYSDALAMPTGKWRVDSNNKASQMQNLPVSKAGILEVKYLHGNDGSTAYTGSYKYAMLTYTVIDGNKYERAFNSDGTAGNITNDTGWQKIQTSSTKATLVTNTTSLKLDVTKKNSAWYGAIKLTYLYDTSPTEIEISFRSVTDDLRWAVINGQKYVKQITFTQDSSNTSHYTIGIEFAGTTYGCYQAEVIGDFADINSLTGEAFTGAKTAVYSSPWGKNNGVTLVSAPEDIGLTFPCTTVQLVQAMRNTFNKTITSGAIGVFNNGGNTITDAPSDYGLLHIEVFGHDRVMIRYDGISGSTYAGSWIGKIKGSNGTFSEVTFEREDNNYSTDEQVIGTWIDGTPLCRKVISLSNIEAKTSMATVELGEAPVNQQYIIKIEGYMNLIGNQYFIHYPNIASDDNYIDAKLSMAGRTISLTGTWKYPIGTGAIIIEYLKS